MGGLRIDFFVPGDALPQLSAVLTRFADAMTDLSEPFEEIADDLTERIQPEQFETIGARGGVQWAELSEGYAAWKEQNFPGMPILQRTGLLMGALTDASAPGHKRVVTKSELRVGVDDAVVPYAKYHQSGTLDHFNVDSRLFDGPATADTPRGMPRRRPILTIEDDRRQWLLKIQRHLVGAAQERSGGLPIAFAS